MLLLNPRLVKFGDATWETITAIAIDRAAHRTAEDWGDLGPYATFADVPEARVRIRITQELTRDDISEPKTGELAQLVFYTAPTSSDAGRKQIAATTVILAVEHELSLKRGAVRTITLAAVSPDGIQDPIQITAADDGRV